MVLKRLRYVCQVDGCGENFVTSRGFKAHAARSHNYLPDDDRAQAERKWIEIQE